MEDRTLGLARGPPCQLQVRAAASGCQEPRAGAVTVPVTVPQRHFRLPAPSPRQPGRGRARAGPGPTGVEVACQRRAGPLARTEEAPSRRHSGSHAARLRMHARRVLATQLACAEATRSRPARLGDLLGSSNSRLAVGSLRGLRAGGHCNAALPEGTEAPRRRSPSPLPWRAALPADSSVHVIGNVQPSRDSRQRHRFSRFKFAGFRSSRTSSSLCR
jgi:hypothetical protein